MTSESGPLAQAEAAFRRGDAAAARALLTPHVAAHPDDARALLVLGAAANVLHDYGAGERHARAALGCWPGAPPASLLNNLGIALGGQGRLGEALPALTSAVQATPNSRDYRANLALHLLAAGKPLEAATVALGAPGAPENVIAAIVAWEQGDLARCRQVLDRVRPGFQAGEADGMDARQWHNLDVYRRYLGRLLAYRAAHAPRYLAPAAPPLFLIGDSHVLGPAGMRLAFLGRGWRAQPRLVMGAKAWHLARGVDDRYGRAFAIAMDRLPAGATAIAIFGEIDCRADEGIVPHARAHPDQPLDGAIADIVRGYTGFVRAEAARRGVEVHFAGVPAPNPAAFAALDVDAAVLATVAHTFNALLATAAAEAGVAFVDVYRLTAGPAGLADGRCHIDTHHLLPAVFADAARGARRARGARAA